MKNKKGFTIIEIIVCIALIASIAAISIITINKNNENAKKESKLVNEVINSSLVYYDKHTINENDLIEKNGYTTIYIDNLINDGLIDEKYYNSIEKTTNFDFGRILISYDFSTGMRNVYYPYSDNERNSTIFKTIYLQNGEEFDCNAKDIIENKILGDQQYLQSVDINSCDSSKIDYTNTSNTQYVYFNYTVTETDVKGKTISVTKKAKLPVQILKQFDANDFECNLYDTNYNLINILNENETKLLNQSSIKYSFTLKEEDNDNLNDYSNNLNIEYKSDDEPAENYKGTFIKKLITEEFDKEYNWTPNVKAIIYPNYFPKNKSDNMDIYEENLKSIELYDIDLIGSKIKYMNETHTYNLNFYINKSNYSSIKNDLESIEKNLNSLNNGKQYNFNYNSIDDKKEFNLESFKISWAKDDVIDVDTIGTLGNLMILNVTTNDGDENSYHTILYNMVDNSYDILFPQYYKRPLKNFKYDDNYLYAYYIYSYRNYNAIYNNKKCNGTTRHFTQYFYDKFKLMKDNGYYSGIDLDDVERVDDLNETSCGGSHTYSPNFKKYNELKTIYNNENLNKIGSKVSDFIKTVSDNDTKDIKGEIHDKYKYVICNQGKNYCDGGRYYLSKSEIYKSYNMKYYYKLNNRENYIFVLNDDSEYMKIYKYSFGHDDNYDLTNIPDNEADYNFVVIPNESSDKVKFSSDVKNNKNNYVITEYNIEDIKNKINNL